MRNILLPLFVSALSFSALAQTNQPFSSDPQQIATQARAVSAPEGMPAVVSLDEWAIHFDEQGRRSMRHHLVYRVVTTAGADSWGSTSAYWEPWHEEKPVLSSRVISADGAVHMLDPNTIKDTSVKDDDEDIYSDGRILRAPLPAVAPGAVIEEIIETRETKPQFAGGTVRRTYVGRTVPVEKVHLTLEFPDSLTVKYAIRGLSTVTPKRSTEAGNTTVTYDLGPLAAIDEKEEDVAPEELDWPRLEVATGKSWKGVAETYSNVVEEKSRPSPEIQAMVAKAIAGKKDRLQVISALSELLQKQVRYTGVEFGEAALIPHDPAETLKHKYGDCKDKSTLLVTMLRAAGIEAHLALLNSGTDMDVDTEMPGMGEFDHAIVYVPGSPEVWIDATAQYHRAGELPYGDQGRLALIAAPGVTELKRIPEISSAENRTVETREFRLAEYGKAKVTETTRAFGPADAQMRSQFGEAISKDMHKELEDYVKNTYLAESLGEVGHGDGKDFEKPFELKLVADKATRGSSDESEAVVAIFVTNLLSRLPGDLTKIESDDNKTEAQKADDKRKHTLQLQSAYTYEWQYHVVPPVGFRSQPVPANTSRNLGPMQLEAKYAIASDGAVDATFRFDSKKRRFTAAEVEQVRAAYKELANEPAILLHFDNIGHAYLQQGKVKEALAEFRNLQKLHPQEGLHHAQAARALLSGGLGLAARKEAEAAVRLEPTAQTYATLGWVLEHDALGRRLREGFDRDGSVKAYKKASELDPQEKTNVFEMAIVQEYNTAGERYGAGADLAGAEATYRSVIDTAREGQFAENLPILLFRAGKYEACIEELDKIGKTPQRLGLKLAALAMSKGPKSALTESAGIGDNSRAAALHSAGATLMTTRHYPEAGALMKVAAASMQNSAQVAGIAELLTRTEPLEDRIQREKGPARPVLQMIGMLTDPNADQHMFGLFSKAILPSEKSRSKQVKDLRNAARGLSHSMEAQGLTAKVAMDLGASLAQFTVDGDDETGYRVRMAGTSEKPETYFVVKEGAEYKIAGGTGKDADTSDVGAYLLSRVDAGAKPEELRRWLDWLREEVKGGSTDDALGGPVFARFWRRGQDADLQTMRVAVAVLAAPHENPEHALQTLQESRKNAGSPEQLDNLDLAIAPALLRLKKYDEFEKLAKGLLDRHPESDKAFELFTQAAGRTHNYKGWQDAIDARLKRLPDDEIAIGSLGGLQNARGDYKAGRATAQRVIAKGKATSGDYNSLAWSTLFDGSTAAQAVADAERSVMMSKRANAPDLHTLASVYVEVGKNSEAKDALFSAMDLWGLAEPNADCWYVLGRLAEAYGEVDTAKQFYKSAERPEEWVEGDMSSYSLIQKRLKELNEKSTPAKELRAAS